MHVKETDNIIILSPYASLDIDVSILLKYKISELFESEPQKNLIINLTNAEYICSTGLNIIMSTKKLLDQAGKSFKLCNAGEEVMEIFSIVKFDDYFEIYETEEEAINSFKSTSK